MTHTLNAGRVAVVGVGTMGKRHCRVLRAAGLFDLVGVYDPDPAAVHLAETRMFATEAEAIASADVLVFATPTAVHASGVRRALLAGRHVLVEKPLCATSAEAHGLVAAATRAARHLFVGHSERFNPVVRALRSLLRTDASPVVSLQFRREAPRRAGCDAGVLVNLAVHDFDLIAHITGGPVTVVAAVGDDDTAHVLVRASGATAHLHVSRVAPAKRRTLVVQTERFLYEGDLLGPRLTRASADGETTDVPLATVEPLVAQAHALALALTGTTSAPLATGTHGAQAVFLAEQAEILLRMDEVD